jgi:transcriptional antiterminator NusG
MNSWYVIKVMPGKERSLNEEFNKQISLGKIGYIERFICPTEKELILVKQKKTLREKVIYSGYLYFETKNRLTEDEIKNVSMFPNVMGIMGDRRPLLMNQSDIKRILKDDDLLEHLESKKLKYITGESVVIIDGPFKSFNGIVSEIKGEKVDVEVKIFGRSNNIELNLTQIEKI